MYAFVLEGVLELQFLETTANCAWAVDQNQKIIHWNAGAEVVFGYKREEVLGRYCFDVMRSVSTDGEIFCKQSCDIIEQMQTGEAITPKEVIVTDKNGRCENITMSTILLPQTSTNPTHSILIHLSNISTKDSTLPYRLTVSFLGKIMIQLPDGTVVKGKLWNRIKTQALFAYLMMMPGKPVARDLILDALWPEMPHQSALRNLNTTVYNLRRSLEPNLGQGKDSQFVYYNNAHYWLENNLPPWIDYQTFEAHLRQARQTALVDQKLALYQKALSLYQGDFLEDLNSITDWHLAEQARLQHLYLAALKETAVLQEQQQETEAAQEIYAQLYLSDPYNETAVQGLMRLALQQGERATVVSYYTQFAQTLQQEMGITPNKETTRLYTRALQ